MTTARIIISGAHAPNLKVSAIKALRVLTGCGLKEGKEAVENCVHEPLTFAVRTDSDDPENLNLPAHISHLRATGITVKMVGGYEEYADQLKEIATTAMLKGDYYVAKNIAAFLEQYF